MRLGSLLLKSPAMLSPLESVSDVGFRSLCGRLGAGLTWTEMIRAQALGRGNRSAMDLVDTFESDKENPTGIQLLAKTPQALKQALRQLENSVQDGSRVHYLNTMAIDLNFGCPSPTILREGAGPALLKRRKRLAELFEVLLEWKSSTQFPIGAIGCKIRLGLNQAEVADKIYLDAASIAASSGLDYITVHARHAAQRSSVPADWNAIKEIKGHLSGKNIAVIGNGDVYTAVDVQRMMDETRCDGVMLARGAIKNPWVFRDIISTLNDKSASTSLPISPSPEEVEAEEAKYLAFAANRDTKSKYTDFHSLNFKRLLNVARAGSSGADIPFNVPRNIHL